MPAPDPALVPRPDVWQERVNEQQTDVEAKRVRLRVRRGRPYCKMLWMKETARRLGLGASLRPRGRTRKVKAEEHFLFASGNDE
jgi:hypothetical protein